MIGRGVFGNLWVFSKDPSRSHNQEELFSIMDEHIRLWDETWGSTKNFAILKKFFKIYVSGFEHASNLRARFMETSSCVEVQQVLSSFRNEQISKMSSHASHLPVDYIDEV